MQPETRFKIRIRKELEAIPRSWWVKTQMLSVLGIPDILGCINGQFVALELKVDSPVTKLQRYVLSKITAAGGFAGVVTPDSWPTFLRTLRNLAPNNRSQVPSLVGVSD